MCGIAGWVSFERDLAGFGATLDAMTDCMTCRGPDARGIWAQGHAALGHRRLSVIDLSGGRQPMRVDTPGGPVVITYSGEAYNYLELRAELQGRGHRFRTDSDTEVVLRGYLEWGSALATRLNGMYAFAVWDARVQRLLMIRDRMGVKPFFYYPTPDGVLFGSEPKAILANPMARRVVDADGLREILVFNKTPGCAVWSGMRELIPGTLIEVSPEGLREQTYWRLRAVPHTDDRETTIARVRELMDDTVRRQLIADVPRCVLLSGGLDSSAVTALAAGHLGAERVRTFAVDFVGQTENFVPDDLRPTADTPFVHDMARHVGSAHEDIVIDQSTLSDPALRRAVVTARDVHIGWGDMDASLYLLFKAIRERSTVALSGESADELFGGYRWYHDSAIEQYEMFPWISPTYTASPSSDPLMLLAPEAASILDIPTYLADTYRSAVSEVDTLPGETPAERRMRVLTHLNLTRFVPMLLDRKDRISMAVSLEVRVPYCDHRLVDYVHNVPWALKSFDGREKSLLRAATQDILPRSVVERVKTPYPSTQDSTYAASLQQQCKELLTSPDPALFTLINTAWLTEATQQDPATVTTRTRHGLERVLDLSVWLDLYHPRIRL